MAKHCKKQIKTKRQVNNITTPFLSRIVLNSELDAEKLNVIL